MLCLEVSYSREPWVLGDHSCLFCKGSTQRFQLLSGACCLTLGDGKRHTYIHSVPATTPIIQRLPGLEGSQGCLPESSLPVKVFLLETVSSGVLGSKTMSLSSLCPPTMLVHGGCSASVRWLVPGASAQWAQRSGGPLAQEQKETMICSLLFLGQGSFTQVRNCFSIAHAPCQAVSSSLHTLTPYPGFIFPAKSPDRTWPGTSLSELPR